MSNFKISVIVTLFNKSKYIRRALLSVIHQTYDNLEIIVIDDASTDDSFAVARLASCNDARFVFISNETNLGQAKTLNVGISQCTGNIIAFLDADFFWSLDHLEKVVSKFNEHPNSGLVYSHIINHRYKKIEGIRPYKEILSNGFLCSTSCISVDTIKFRDIGCFPITFAVDDEACFMMGKSFEIRLIDEETVVYAKNPDSLTNNSLTVCSYKLDLLDKYKYDIFEYCGKSVYASHLYRLSYLAFSFSHFGFGLRCLARAVLMHIDLRELFRLTAKTILLLIRR